MKHLRAHNEAHNENTTLALRALFQIIRKNLARLFMTRPKLTILGT